jgi:uncharacterized protein (TIGR02271 family)
MLIHSGSIETPTDRQHASSENYSISGTSQLANTLGSTDIRAAGVSEMSEQLEPEASIPLVQERLTLDKRSVETGRVRIHTVVDEKLVRVAEDLERDDVTIERVAVNAEVTEAPRTREENGVLIVPILEEVVVVEKRLFLKEELHVHRNRKRERVEEAVRLKSMRAEVERVAAEERTATPGTEPERHAGSGPRPLIRRKARLSERPK